MINLYQPEKIGQFGIIEGGDTEYFAFPAVNCSRFKWWLRSERHFEANPSKEATQAMAMGTAFHAMLSMPGYYKEKYREFIKPFPGSTMGKTENKEAWKDFEEKGYILTTEKETRALEHMAESVDSNPLGQWIKKRKDTNINERGIWFVHNSGIICKIKPDILQTTSSGALLPIDLKKSKDASEKGFRNDCRSYDYPLQDAFYSMGIEVAFPDREILPFHFLMCESTEPFLSQHYTIAKWQRLLIQQWIDETLETIADKIKNKKKFKGYSDGLIEVELPEYYTNKYLS